jgi:hypothetical protein
MLLESYRRQSFLQFVSPEKGLWVLTKNQKQEKLSFLTGSKALLGNPLTGSKALPGNPYLEALPRHRIREAEPPD